MKKIIILCCIFIVSLSVIAQDSDSLIIFEQNKKLWAQPADGGQLINLGVARQDFANDLPSYDVYTLSASLITRPLDDGFGFHHGVWSADRTQFAYIEMRPPEYRLRLIQDGEDRIVMTGQIRDNLAYLDPVQITSTGRILLLERQALNHLHKVNMFIVTPDPLELDFYTAVATGHLVGRTALLPDSYRLFLGFDFDNGTGVILNTGNGQIERFPLPFQIEHRGFEHLPIPVYGAIQKDELIEFAQSLTSRPTKSQTESYPAPFLHWALADNHRDITCYTDSDWTYSNFSTNCPGLAGRDYQGHEGTDISQEPDALLIGTPVYPSAVGTIVDSYRDCLGVNPSCNNAYGNTLTMEHIQIVNNETQVWYTGYGHLQMVISETASYIDDLTQPIALSGATGVGGAHLHFEVRTPDGWVDPWNDFDSDSLWVGGNERPSAMVLVDDMGSVPKILDVCTSYAKNNIRSGAGTTHQAVDETVEGTTYYITTIENIQTGEGIGDWYEVLYEGGQGWLWSGVMNCP